MVVSGISWVAIPYETYYELSIYDMSTYKLSKLKILRHGGHMATEYIKLPRQLVDKVKEAAAKEEISPEEFVRGAVETRLDRGEWRKTVVYVLPLSPNGAIVTSTLSVVRWTYRRGDGHLFFVE